MRLGCIFIEMAKLKKWDIKPKGVKMKKILILALLAMNAYAACNTNGKSTLFEEWKEQWGEYKWGEDAQINQYSVVETNGAFKDMIRACDMVGLQQMLDSLRKEQILSNQESQGSFYTLF